MQFWALLSASAAFLIAMCDLRLSLIFFCHNLYFLTMVEWENEDKDSHPARSEGEWCLWRTSASLQSSDK